jgi:hypothetical protein
LQSIRKVQEQLLQQDVHQAIEIMEKEMNGFKAEEKKCKRVLSTLSAEVCPLMDWSTAVLDLI